MTKSKYDTNIAYKFVLYKIKKLICDSRGKPRYISNFDKVVNEIFGINHFGKKLSQVYDNRDFIAILDKIGIDILMEITQSSVLYNAMDELVRINYRLDELKEYFRKQTKKGARRDKNKIKEYNYLCGLHKNAVKMFRKKFGIKNTKDAYKRRYKSLTSFVDKGKKKYDDDGFSSILFSDDPFYGDFDDDDDFDDYGFGQSVDRFTDEYSETSELEDFVNLLHGTPTRKGRPSSVRNTRSRISDIEDFDLDEEDDDFDDFERPRKRRPSDLIANPELEDRVELLASTVQDLASSVQSVLMRDEYEKTTGVRKQAIEVSDYLKEIEARKAKTTQTPVQTVSKDEMLSYLENISSKLDNVEKDNDLVKEAMGYMIDKHNELVETVDAIIEYEDDDEEDAVDITLDERGHKIINGVDFDKYPDLYEEIAKEEAMEAQRKLNPTPDTISRDELIDMINKSANTEQEMVFPQVINNPQVVSNTTEPTPGQVIG